MPSPYRLNKPRQITLKDYNEEKLKQIVANKKGWECVMDIKKVKNTYDGSTMYMTVMRFVGEEVNA